MRPRTIDYPSCLSLCPVYLWRYHQPTEAPVQCLIRKHSMLVRNINMTLQALKVTGTVNEQGQLVLDRALELPENSHVEVIILMQNATSEAEDTPDEEVLADLRQAWHEAMTGQTIPVSQLWDGIDDEA